MENFELAQKLIEENDVITIFGHAGPDGDCYGSQLGLRNIIKKKYPHKKVFALGSGLPSFFDRLGEMDVVEDEVIAQSLVVLVDVSCLRRCEDPRCHNGKAFLKFDHHRPNEKTEHFDGVSVVDYHRIAACEIIAEFALEYGYEIDSLIAECLYLGIDTDSGRLRFHGTTQRTLWICDYLVQKGADVKALEAIAFYKPPHILNMISYIKGKARRNKDVVYAIVTKEECQKMGVTPEEALRQVNALARFPSHIYCLFVYFDETIVRVEFRSNEGYPVHLTAMRHRGGGHKYASGGELHLDVEPDGIAELTEELNLVERDTNDDD